MSELQKLVLFLVKEKDLYKRFVNETPKILHHRIENFIGVGFPDDVLYINNKFYTCELKYTNHNKIKISPFQISFAMQHPIGHYFLIGYKKEVKLFESKSIDDLLKDGFKTKNPIANNWKDIRDYLYKL
jgi:hypothetical protein